VILDDNEAGCADNEAGCPVQDTLMEEFQLQESVREAVSKLSGRCRRLVDMLFFHLAADTVRRGRPAPGRRERLNWIHSHALYRASAKASGKEHSTRGHSHAAKCLTKKEEADAAARAVPVRLTSRSSKRNAVRKVLVCFHEYRLESIEDLYFCPPSCIKESNRGKCAYRG
jgi:hypothetical protein